MAMGRLRFAHPSGYFQVRKLDERGAVCHRPDPVGLKPDLSPLSRVPTHSGDLCMIPGEIQTARGEIEINAGRPTLTVSVANTGDRPIQVGSHYHFHETNTALAFDREATRGYRLNIPAGTAVRFEPGQARNVELVALDGSRVVYGFQGKVMGAL